MAASEFGFAYSIIERFGDLQGLMGTAGWSHELLRGGNYIDAMALMRKSTWERVGGYNRMKIGGWEDYDFGCKCVGAGIDGLPVGTQARAWPSGARLTRSRYWAPSRPAVGTRPRRPPQNKSRRV